MAAVVGCSGAVAAYLMDWRAILSERRLTPTERRKALLRLSPQEVRRIDLLTRVLFVTTGLGTPTRPSVDRDEGRLREQAWSDCRFRAQCASSDIVFSTSDDGTTWSPVHRIPIDPVSSTVDHFIPGLAVDPHTAGGSTHLALGYYFYPISNCTSSSCQLSFGFVSSTDAGKTWTSGETIAGPMRLSWLANTSQGPMVGDYVSTSIVPGTQKAFPFFALAKPPANGVLDEALYTTANEALTVRAGNVAVSNDAVQAHTSAPARAARRLAPTAF